MAQHEIIRKLERELAEPIHSERQVVYILVEVRKLMELTGQLSNYPVLTFYCNWVVHPRLERKSAPFVEPFDKYHKLIDMSSVPANQGTVATTDLSFLKDLTDTVHMEKFRQELASYLLVNSLDTQLTDNKDAWVTFFLDTMVKSSKIVHLRVPLRVSSRLMKLC